MGRETGRGKPLRRGFLVCGSSLYQCKLRHSSVIRVREPEGDPKEASHESLTLGWGELDPMRHTKRGFGDLAGWVGVRIGSKRPKPNPDTPLGRHNSLRYRTVGANAIIQLFEANRRNPGTATDQYKEFW